MKKFHLMWQLDKYKVFELHIQLFPLSNLTIYANTPSGLDDVTASP